MHQKPITGPAPSQMAQRFLHLLDDVNQSQGLFLEEIATLRARIQELEGTRPEHQTSTNLPDIEGCAIYLESPQGSIQAWSGGAREMYGYTVEDVVGRPASMLSPAGCPGTERGHISDYSERIGKDGRAFRVLSHDVALQDGGGRLLGRLRLEMLLPGGEVGCGS
jgi:PAS domain-containing protein